MAVQLCQYRPSQRCKKPLGYACSLTSEEQKRRGNCKSRNCSKYTSRLPFSRLSKSCLSAARGHSNLTRPSPRLLSHYESCSLSSSSPSLNRSTIHTSASSGLIILITGRHLRRGTRTHTHSSLRQRFNQPRRPQEWVHNARVSTNQNHPVIGSTHTHTHTHFSKFPSQLDSRSSLAGLTRRRSKRSRGCASCARAAAARRWPAAPGTAGGWPSPGDPAGTGAHAPRERS